MFGLQTFILYGFTELQYILVITACLYSDPINPISAGFFSLIWP